jgi:hypothetical protein
MRSLCLGSAIAIWMLVPSGCHDNTGLRLGVDAGKNGGAGGGTAGTGGSKNTSATGGAGSGDTFGGPDAANDKGSSDVGVPDAKEASASEGHGAMDSAPIDSNPLCSEVPCLASLFLPCQPSATCTSDDTTTTTPGADSTSSYCYSNGVKQQTVSSLSGDGIIYTYIEKRDTGMCFTIEATISLTGGTALYVFRDGNGSQVATGTAALDTSILVVACNGGKATQVSQSCLDTASIPSACSTGSCVF